MNKLTLSAAALTAIVAPAQMQAADSTPEQIKKANKTAIDKLLVKLSTATNNIEAAYEAAKGVNDPDLKALVEKLKADNLLEISKVASEMNGYLEEMNKPESVVEPISDDMLNTWEMRFNTASNTAVKAINASKDKDDLLNLCGHLKKEYDDAVNDVKIEKYPLVGEAWAETLKNMGVNELIEEIKALDPTNGNTIDKSRYEQKIAQKQKEVVYISKNIEKWNDDAKTHAGNFKSVEDAFNETQVLYAENIQKAIANLPSDSEYYVWQKKAIDELKKELQKAQDELNKAKEDFDKGDDTIDGTSQGYTEKIGECKSAIETIVGKYVADMQSEKNAVIVAENAVKGLYDEYDRIYGELKACDGTELDDCLVALNAVKTEIDNLKKTLEGKHNDLDLRNYEYSDDVVKIKRLTGQISDNGNPAHGYKFLVDNYKAKKAMLADITEAEKTLEENVKAATENMSKKGNYSAAAYFTLNDIVKANIEKLKGIVADQYKGKTAYSYYGEEGEGDFKTELDNINTDNSKYKTDTEAALEKYSTAQQKAETAQNQLDRLKGYVSDETATIDGTVGGKTYGAIFEELKAEIDAITDALDKARKKKDGDHLSLLTAANNLTVCGGNVITDVYTEDAYKTNKAAYDKASAIAAAKTMLDASGAKITTMKKTIEGIVKDKDSYGPLAEGEEGIIAEANRLSTSLTAENGAMTTYEAAKTKYENVTDEDKKQAAAVEAIAVLKDVNADLDEVEPELDALKEYAKNAKENYAAYKEVETAAGKATAKVTDLNDILVSVAGEEAKAHYEGELQKLQDQINEQLTKSDTEYRNFTLVGTSKDSVIETLKGIMSDVALLEQDAKKNKKTYETQENAVNELTNNWQIAYNEVSQKDLSGEANTYLEDLAKRLEEINNLKGEIKENFKVGKSVTPGIDDKIAEIQEAIDKISGDSKGEYIDNVFAGNKAQHDSFLNTYRAAKTAYGEAVDHLNKFKTIKNLAMSQAINDLIPTHDYIYSFAEKLRDLLDRESKEYVDSYSKEALEDLKYGENRNYNAKSFIDDAQVYKADIDDAINNYRKTVNDIAIYNYEKLAKGAKGKLAKYKTTISEFVCDGKDTAFDDVKKVVDEAVDGSVKDENGNIADPLYAYHMETWLTTLEGCEDMLDAELEALCQEEKTKRMADADIIYEADKLAIDELKEIDNEYYKEYLDSEYQKHIAVAKTLEADADNIFEIIGHFDAFAQYTLKDGEKVPGHSAVYDEAYNKSVRNKANIAAYERMGSDIAAIEEEFLEVKVAVNKLVGHEADATSRAITSVAEDLEAAKTGLEETYGKGGCVAFEANKFKGWKENVLGQIASLKESAVLDEVTTLQDKLVAVTEQYNNYVKDILDDSEALEVAKGYEDELTNLDTELVGFKGKFNALVEKVGKDAAYTAAIEKLPGLEKRVAALNSKLNGLWDTNKSQINTAAGAVQAKLDEVKKAIETAGPWVDFDDVHYNSVKGTYLKMVQNLCEEYNRIEEDFNVKKGTGDILFYKSNMLFDLDKVLEDTPKEDGDLYTLYKKYHNNMSVFDDVKEWLDKAGNDLTDAYNRVKDLKCYKLQDDKRYVDKVKENISCKIEEIRENVKADYDNISLDGAYKADYADRIDAVKNSIDNNLELDAKHYHIYKSIRTLKSKIEDYLFVLNNTNNKFSDESRSRLTGVCNTYYGKLTNADDFNQDATGRDGTLANKIHHDIDGEDVRNNRSEVECNYNDNAFIQLQNLIDGLGVNVTNLGTEIDNCVYIEGDVDRDGEVNVNDYSEVRNIILSGLTFEKVKAEIEGKALAADLNGDLDINVADLTGMSNILLHGKWNWNPASNGAKKTRAKVSAEDEINISNEGEETTIFGKTVRMAVNLAHSEAFTSGQMDITMPQGMKIVGQSMSDRANGHDIFANDLGNGVTRLLTATIDNNEFNGRNGALIYLDVEVSSDFSGGQISIDNIIFSDAAGRMYTMSSIGGNGDGATGIDGIKAATVKERIYSVGGQMMKAVKKGINIIVGEDGKARKIVNK